MKRNGTVLCRLLAVVLTLALALSLSVGATTAPAPTRVADPATLNNWERYFGDQVMSTEFAGGVWVDKSVFAAESEHLPGITLSDPENFLVALSAIGASKSEFGFSEVPTDTVFVLDASASMLTDGSTVPAMIQSVNHAIHSLQQAHEKNRVGVVLYSVGETAGEDLTEEFLDLDRYTVEGHTGTDAPAYLTYENGVIATNQKLVEEGVPGYLQKEREVRGSTNMQDGLLHALEEFRRATEITANGHTNTPALVLMSDGTPTFGTTAYTTLTATSDLGDGRHTSAELAFAAQLTASYVRREIQAKYNGVEPLFYTIGFGFDALSDDDRRVAKAVLNPTGSTVTDEWWEAYRAASGTYEGFAVDTTLSTAYLTDVYLNGERRPGYFAAGDAEHLTNTFDQVIAVIENKAYYPTMVESNANHAGYIAFDDHIGEGMEVKDIKGLLLGDTLFSGAAMAAKITEGADGLGTVEHPTALGNQFIWSIQERLGIDTVEEARQLAAKAWKAGQLAYNAQTGEFSNYIGWYADKDGNYLGFWNGDERYPDKPVDAAYVNRSYGFLGQSNGNIARSDMMYMVVQVHTNIENGNQAVIFKIPAALLPVVVYHIEYSDHRLEEATLTRTPAEPLRLVYEAGLKPGITADTVADLVDKESKHYDKETDTYYFYTNRWGDEKDGSLDYEGPFTHLATLADYTPSLTNARYYYTEDRDVCVKNGDQYEAFVGDRLEEGVTYYQGRPIFVCDEGSNHATRQMVYEPISADTLKLAQKSAAGFYIPAGTPYHYFNQYVTYKGGVTALQEAENLTDTLPFTRNAVSFETETGEIHVHAFLGNNGRISIRPAKAEPIAPTKPSEGEVPTTVPPSATGESASALPLWLMAASGVMLAVFSRRKSAE